MAQRRVVLTRNSGRSVGEPIGQFEANSVNGESNGNSMRAAIQSPIRPRRQAVGGTGPYRALNTPHTALDESSVPKTIKSARNKLRYAVENGNEDRVALLAAQYDLLTAKERDRLLDQLAFTKQMSMARNGGSSDPDVEMWASAVHWALERSIASTGGEGYGLLLVKRQLGSSSNWRPVKAFMVDSGLMELNRAKRNGVYSMLAELLVEHAEYVSDRSGAPLSAKLVASCAVNLPGLFEQQFPGYLASGLAHFAAAQMSSTIR